MSATESFQESPSPETKACTTPVLGAPRQTTDLELTHSRPSSTIVASPIDCHVSEKSVRLSRIASRIPTT